MGESFEHAILVDLFQTFPEMIVPLLRTAGGRDRSRRDAAEDRTEGAADEDAGEEPADATPAGAAAGSATLPAADPVAGTIPDLEACSADVRVVAASAAIAELAPPEFRADAVLHFMVPGNARPAHGGIVEIQRRRDVDKLFSWPTYAINLRQRTRCPVTLVVVTPSEHVARWAAQPIALGGGNFYRPVVIGPSRIPRITNLGQAWAMPALSVLSAVVHGRKRGAEEIVRAALAAACPALDSEQAKVYAHYLGTLPSAERLRAPEVPMRLIANRPPESFSLDDPYARHWIAKGEQLGRVRALHQILIEQLTERFGALPEVALARIDEADEDQLARWGRRVLSAASLDQVLDTQPEPR
jgi:hypothetical protein